MIATDSIIKSVALKRYKRITEAENIDHLPYHEWLKLLFPGMYSRPFSIYHEHFWQHIDNIPDGRPPAYFLVLGREEGKDANGQGAVINLGAKGKRKFAIYVCATQETANKNIQTIAGMLEGSTIERYYPEFANRQLTKYGHSKGWRTDMLRCGNGFNIVGLGLDVAVRGIRLDQFRPDIIICSDIDSRKDTPETVQKKIDILKFDILPAGTKNTIVLFLQNLVHENSIVNKVVTNKADFLFERIVNGPIPAIEGFQSEEIYKDDKLYHQITAGTPTWETKTIAEHESLLNQIGPTAFRIECQHEINLVEDGYYKKITYRRCNSNEVPDLVSIVCACDPAVTEDGDKQAIQIDGIGIDNLIYRLYSWEENSSPSQAIIHAIIKIIEYGGDVIVFETDQGGDLWEEGYNTAWELLCTYSDIKQWLNTLPAGTDLQDAIDDKYPQGYDLEDVLEYAGKITWDTVQPDFVASRAGSIGSKKHRGQLQVKAYEAGHFIHVRGTHNILELALSRFPKRKPFDLHDAAFWSQWELLENAPAGN